MKKLDLRISGAVPLTCEEEQTISGGSASLIFKLLGGAGGLIAGAIIDDWDNFKAGIMGKPERSK